MKTEKVMSVYNLQDEGKLGAILDGVEGLKFGKIGEETCDGKESSRYYMSMDGIGTGGELLGRLAQFVQENEKIQIKFCSPEKAGYQSGKKGEMRG